MGGIFKSIFSSPKPETIIQSGSSTAVDDEEIKARQRRSNQSEYSNITTSNRGLLNQVEEIPRRKNLLGE